MTFEDLLDHKCSIYHMIKSIKNMGYEIKSSTFTYPSIPDISEIPCHFTLKDGGNLDQTEDINEYRVVGKLQLPFGTEVYVNDKIVDLADGMVYTAEIPKNIRNHHMIVNIQRKGKIKGAL